MAFLTLKEIVDCAKQQELPFWKIVMQSDQRERNVSEAESFGMMRMMYQAMRQADEASAQLMGKMTGGLGGLPF